MPGSPRASQASDLDRPRTSWMSAGFRAYADHMETPELGEAFAELLDLATDRTTAMMCAEAVPWRCHRQLVADALVARGRRVVHILAPRWPISSSAASTATTAPAPALRGCKAARRRSAREVSAEESNRAGTPRRTPLPEGAPPPRGTLRRTTDTPASTACAPPSSRREPPARATSSSGLGDRADAACESPRHRAVRRRPVPPHRVRTEYAR